MKMVQTRDVTNTTNAKHLFTNTANNNYWNQIKFMVTYSNYSLQMNRNRITSRRKWTTLRKFSSSFVLFF